MTRSESKSIDLEPGATLADKYRLLRPIGEGGMSTVWLATNSALAVDVAVKFIKTELGERGAQRLLNEARTAARLQHPYILEIHDCGQAEDGSPFIVMEHLKGSTLGDMVAAGGRLSAVEAVGLLLPIADALAYAHAQGVVHRDIKPDNIFVAQTVAGVRPKILDFGIAKSSVTDGRLTCRGEVLGSPDYMSPEQARGNEVDHRTDIWSFCAMLYEAVTGTPPFSGRNYNATLIAILEQEVVPLTDLNAGDASLWAVLRRGMEKRVSDRYPSMQALGRDLASWLLSHGVSQDACHTSLQAHWLGDAERPANSNTSAGSSPSVVPLTRSLPVRESKAAKRRRIGAREVVACSIPLLALLVGTDWSPATSPGAQSPQELAAAGVPLAVDPRVAHPSERASAPSAEARSDSAQSRKAESEQKKESRPGATKVRRAKRAQAPERKWPLPGETAAPLTTGARSMTVVTKTRPSPPSTSRRR